MEVQELQGRDVCVCVCAWSGVCHESTTFAHFRQRESSATIKTNPKAYEATDPPKRQDILEFDCRGLEFVDFKPEVRRTRACIIDPYLRN